MGTSVNTTAEDVKKQEDKEEKEESILVMLSIIGIVLNLLVMVFYISVPHSHRLHSGQNPELTRMISKTTL